MVLINLMFFFFNAIYTRDVREEDVKMPLLSGPMLQQCKLGCNYKSVVHLDPCYRTFGIRCHSVFSVILPALG